MVYMVDSVMRRAFTTVAALLLLALAAPMPLAQNAPAVPTLVAPTLVPAAATDERADFLHAESAIAEITASGILRVGVLYNDPPYSELTFRANCAVLMSICCARSLPNGTVSWNCCKSPG